MGAWDRLSPQEQLHRLREARPRTQRDTTPLSSAFDAEARSLRRMERRLAGVGDAWLGNCPPALLDKTSILGVQRRILTIRASDASTRYQLDRWLRSGGERAVISACVAPIQKIRVVA